MSLPRFYAKTWQGDIITAQYGGTGNNSGFIRAGLANGTTAGANSTAEGSATQSTGRYSHTEGAGTIAKNQSQHVFGEYNIQDPSSNGVTSKGTYVEIVGNGSSSARSNARTLDWSGNETLSGTLTVGVNPTSEMHVATKQYVDNGLSGKQNSLPTSNVANQLLVTTDTSGSVAWKNINTTLTLTAGTSSAAPKLQVTVLNTASSTVTLTTATTTAYGVTKLSSTASTTEQGLAATPKGVNDAATAIVTSAINALDVTTSGGAVNKTITALTQTDGKISATYSAIGSLNTSVLTGGTLGVARGGTGITSNPSMLVNLASTTADTVFKTSPQPGVTGTLPVVNGGTGRSTMLYKNAVLIGNASTVTSAMQAIRTASGAFYATAQDGKPAFGTLPIAQGGTGLAASPSMLTNLASTTAANVLAASPRPGVTGTLPVGNGGTGATTFDSNSVLIGNGTSAIGTRGITNETAAKAIVTGTNIPTMNTIYYGLPKINNSRTYTSSTEIYAPLNGGVSGYVLTSSGNTTVPVWSPLTASFLNSTDLDNTYVWDIITQASSSSDYSIEWNGSASVYYLSSGLRYVHAFSACTASTSSTDVTLSGSYQMYTVPGYGQGSVSIASTYKYICLSSSTTKPSSVNINTVYLPRGSVSTGYNNSGVGPYIVVPAVALKLVPANIPSFQTITAAYNAYTNHKTSTAIYLNRGSLRQVLLGSRNGYYIGSGTATFDIRFTDWIPRILVIAGSQMYGSSTIPVSLTIDCHNMLQTGAINNSNNPFNPTIMSFVSLLSAAVSNVFSYATPPVTWLVENNIIKGITLTQTNSDNYNYFNINGRSYQYYALA